MSWRVSRRVWIHSTTRGAARWLLLPLADFPNHDGVCWPARATLARMARLSERHTARLLRSLEAAGELLVVPGGEGPGRTNARTAVGSRQYPVARERRTRDRRPQTADGGRRGRQ